MSDPFETLKDKYMRPAPGFLFHPQVGLNCGFHRNWGNLGKDAYRVQHKGLNIAFLPVQQHIPTYYFYSFSYLSLKLMI